MSNGEKTRIGTRLKIVKDIEKIIKESVYYRSYSELMIESNRIIIGNINKQESKAKIL